MSRLVDLSHTIRAGLVTYPGLPAPGIRPFLTREESKAKYAVGTQFAMDIITMIGNTGTYIDSPFHRYQGGSDLAGLDLETLVDQPAEIFQFRDVSVRGIQAEAFAGREIKRKAVVLDTGWSRLFGTANYAHGAPFLTEGGAKYPVDHGVTLVGIDSLNIDDVESGGERPAHSRLLAAGIHVVEHLTGLDEVPESGSTVTVVPPKIEGFGTFPVRAFARIP